MGGGAGRGITGREGRSASRIHVHSSEDAPLPLLISPSIPPTMEAGSCDQLASRWAAGLPGNGPVFGAQCWSVLLADETGQ